MTTPSNARDEGASAAYPKGGPTSMEIMQAVEEARAFVHPQRAMRVTLECGHYRLMSHVSTIMGIGAWTGCQVCSPDAPGAVSRQVVNVEETGVLHDDWLKRGK